MGCWEEQSIHLEGGGATAPCPIWSYVPVLQTFSRTRLYTVSQDNHAPVCWTVHVYGDTSNADLDNLVWSRSWKTELGIRSVYIDYNNCDLLFLLSNWPLVDRSRRRVTKHRKGLQGKLRRPRLRVCFLPVWILLTLCSFVLIEWSLAVFSMIRVIGFVTRFVNIQCRIVIEGEKLKNAEEKTEDKAIKRCV